MAINKCELDAIRHKANHGMATSQDCCDLLEYMDDDLTHCDFQEKITEAVERAIEDAVDTTRVVQAVEDAVRALKR